MGVAAACQLGATPLDVSFVLADGGVRKAERALKAEWQLVVAIGDHRLGGVGGADSLLDPSRDPAQRRHHIKECEPGMGGSSDAAAAGRYSSAASRVAKLRCRRRIAPWTLARYTTS